MPLHYFFNQHDLLRDDKDGQAGDNDMRYKFDSVFGYTDERDLHYVHIKEYRNNSKYYNNFQSKFFPPTHQPAKSNFAIDQELYS